MRFCGSSLLFSVGLLLTQWIICILAKNWTHFPQLCIFCASLAMFNKMFIQTSHIHRLYFGVLYCVNTIQSKLPIVVGLSVLLIPKHNKRNYLSKAKKKNVFWANKREPNSAPKFINNLLQFLRFILGSQCFVLVLNNYKPFESIEIYRFPPVKSFQFSVQQRFLIESYERNAGFYSWFFSS